MYIDKDKTHSVKSVKRTEKWANVCACYVAQMEANASFLRAARAGTLDKLLECLDHNGADIDASNPVCASLSLTSSNKRPFEYIGRGTVTVV